MHEPAKAEELYLSIVKEHPNYIDCYMRLGCIERDRKQYKAASTVCLPSSCLSHSLSSYTLAPSPSHPSHFITPPHYSHAHSFMLHFITLSHSLLTHSYSLAIPSHPQSHVISTSQLSHIYTSRSHFARYSALPSNYMNLVV